MSVKKVGFRFTVRRLENGLWSAQVANESYIGDSLPKLNYYHSCVAFNSTVSEESTAVESLAVGVNGQKRGREPGLRTIKATQLRRIGRRLWSRPP